jgi:hypothetical protein
MKIRNRRAYVWLAAACAALVVAGSATAGETTADPGDGRTWTAPAGP